MRIIELFENADFDEKMYVNTSDGLIDYDLAEDLVFFMNNNDDVYRSTVYPAVIKCLETLKQKKSAKPSIFKQAAVECYKTYQQKFPIRSLPETLDEALCNEVCKKMFDEICKSEDNKEKD